MKYLFTLFALLLTAGAHSQEQTCYTPEQIVPQMAHLDPDPLDGCYPFSVYVEVDYPLYLKAQSQGRTIESAIEGYLAEAVKLFDAEGLQATFIVYYWKTPSPYAGTNSINVLNSFRAKIDADGGHPGDLAMLLSNLASGGVNYVDVLCNQSFGVGYSSINLSYQPYPQYSWDLMVLVHEVGHGLGSPHSHSCSWPGGAIDGCSPGGVEGNCPDPGLPAPGEGSIMSYCHLRGNIGINLGYGFGPLPLALIKNRIAGADCVECEDDPDGPDDPDPDTCATNQVIVEVLVDLWAQETSWELLDESGAIVARSEPYPKFPINYIYADTLCLPEGCYDFVIKDVDGLVGMVANYEGMYIVTGPSGELASGQDFTGSESTRFCLGVAPPPSDCDEFDLGQYVSYRPQDFNGTTSYDNGELTLTYNNWKAIPNEYTVTPQSVFEAEVRVNAEGEIHGFMFIDNLQLFSASNSIRFAGTQNWGRQVAAVEPGEWTPIRVPIGQFLPLTDYTHVVLINDQDVGIWPGNPINSTSFRNVRICEDDGAATFKSYQVPVIQGKDIDEALASPYPNPVTGQLNLPTFGFWRLLNSSGQQVTAGLGNSLNMAGLPTGLYIIQQGRRAYKIVKL